jgi:hypothetical protein
MKKPDRLKFGAAMGMALALVFYAGAGAWAQLDTDLPGGHLKIQTALETDWGVSTAGKPNRNNNNNHIPGSGQGLSTDGNDLQSANGRIEPLTTFRVNDATAQSMWLDNADVYVHLRFWGDVAQLINGPHVNAVGQGDPTTPGVSRYPGDAWAARVSEHEYEADAAEAYIDLRKGPVSLRLGKQFIVYGEELGLQTLDQVDSLDFTRALNQVQNFALEFSDQRIAEWTAKLSYQLPDFSEAGVNNSVITGFVSPDFQPSYLVGLGSQNNDVPVFEKIGDYGNIRRARNKTVYGAVASTTVYDVDLTANFYSTPDHIGWFSSAPVCPPNSVGTVRCILAQAPIDRFSGSPFLAAAGIPGPRDFLIQRRFSREFIYGGSASYTVPALDFPGSSLLYGDIFHYSVAYTPHKSFTGASTVTLGNPGTSAKKIGEINMTLDGERYLRWTEKFPSMYLLGEYNFRSRSEPISEAYLSARGHHNDNFVVVSLTQPLPNAIWTAAFVAVCNTNTGGDWFLQPAITYKPTSNQEYDVYYNFVNGTVDVAAKHGGTGEHKPGTADWIDAIWFRAVYKM